jgi:serine/threonine protein kinase
VRSSPLIFFFVDRGQAKILDFGLAKLAPNRLPAVEHVSETSMRTQFDSADLLTSPGSSVGTVAYMSPEQARGEELDARADLFSLGVVLYEMSTRVVPFSGSTVARIFDGILNSGATLATKLNPRLPAAIENVFSKALEKDVDLGSWFKGCRVDASGSGSPLPTWGPRIRAWTPQWSGEFIE